jgi:hypothetical protein
VRTAFSMNPLRTSVDMTLISGIFPEPQGNQPASSFGHRRTRPRQPKSRSMARPYKSSRVRWMLIGPSSWTPLWTRRREMTVGGGNSTV